jgi:hypothetical protein
MLRENEQQFLESHKEEFEKIKQFLEIYGITRNYTLFREMAWLVDQFGYSVLYDVLYAAKVLEAIPPVSTKIAFIQKQTDEVFGKLKQLKAPPQLLEMRKSLEGAEKLGDTGQLRALSRELKNLQSRMDDLILNSASSPNADYSWKRAFASNFAYKFLMSNHIPKSKRNNYNEELCKFFDQVASSIRLDEVAPSEEMASIFRK